MVRGEYTISSCIVPAIKWSRGVSGSILMLEMCVRSNSMANSIHLHQGLHEDDPRDHKDGPERLLRILDQPEQGNQ